MSGQERKTGKRVLNVGLLAHVDAGKTTLSEFSAAERKTYHAAA